jgi:site-specific recombinase XerD
MDANEATLASYNRYLRVKGRSERYQKDCRWIPMDLARFHGGADLLELTREQIEDYLLDVARRAGRRKGRTTSDTAAIRYRTLRAFYNWAVREELIPASPMAKIEAPKAPDVPPAVVPDDNLRRLLKACSGTDFESRRDTAIIRLWCEPGSPRVSEMAGIKLADLDMKADRVTVTGKGNKTRTIPFGAKTGQALDRYLRVRRQHRLASRYDHLWLGGRDKPLTSSGLYQMLERRCRQAGIEPLHPHQLRHTAASAWMDAGGSEGEAMVLFGWSSAEMPRVYGRAARAERAIRSARRRSLGDRL